MESFYWKLNEDENIKISYTPLRHILTSAGFISPLCNRSTRRAKKKELEAKNKLTEIDKNIIIDDHILDSENSHPRKPRAKYFGELIQMDASGIVWFGDTYATLHLAVDDASGTVVGAFSTIKRHYMVIIKSLSKSSKNTAFLTSS